MDWYPWIRLLHVLGAFVFIAGHGVSIFMAVSLRRERDPTRVAALLDLSGISLGAMYIGLMTLLVFGVVAGFMHSWWGDLWIWLALGILIVVTVAMYPLGSNFYATVRRAFGIRAYADRNAPEPPVPLSAEEQAALLASPQPIVLMLVGGIGFVLIVWLMVVKPF
jgi:uncharacterized membrane protein